MWRERTAAGELKKFCRAKKRKLGVSPPDKRGIDEKGGRPTAHDNGGNPFASEK